MSRSQPIRRSRILFSSSSVDGTGSRRLQRRPRRFLPRQRHVLPVRQASKGGVSSPRRFLPAFSRDRPARRASGVYDRAFDQSYYSLTTYANCMESRDSFCLEYSVDGESSLRPVDHFDNVMWYNDAFASFELGQGIQDDHSLKSFRIRFR